MQKLFTLFVLMLPSQHLLAKSNSDFINSVKNSLHAECEPPSERYRHECEVGSKAYKGQCRLSSAEAILRVVDDFERRLISYPSQERLANSFFDHKDRTHAEIEHFFILLGRSQCEAGLSNWQKVFNTLEKYPKTIKRVSEVFDKTVFSHPSRNQSLVGVMVDAFLFRYAAEYGLYNISPKGAFELADMIKSFKIDAAKLNDKWNEVLITDNGEARDLRSISRKTLIKLLKEEWQIVSSYRDSLHLWKENYKMNWAHEL